MTKKHLWIMLACCLLPVAAIVAVRVFNVPVGTLGLYALILLCPIGHLLLMSKMMHRMGDMGHHQKTADTIKPIIEDINKQG